MKIVIDGAYLCSKPKGVSVITISILNTYTKNFPDYELYLLVPGEVHDEVRSQIIILPNLFIISEPLFGFIKHPVSWVALKLNRLIRRISPDLVIASNFFINPAGLPDNVKLAVYIHDVVYYQYRLTMRATTRFYMDLFLKKSVARSNILWFNSNYTRTEFLRLNPNISTDKTFIGGSLNPKFKELATKVQANKEALAFYSKFPLAGKYLLFVGTIEPRKNISFLLEIFKNVAKFDFYLVVIGSKGWGNAQNELDDFLDDLNFPGEKVFFTGYIGIEDLINYYKNAYAYISTSLNEGLGIPQLEAMTCGCPVISPDNSAMSDIVKNAGVLIEGWSVNSWVAEILNIEKQRDKLIKMGFEKAKQFDWNTIVNEFDKKFKQVV